MTTSRRTLALRMAATAPLLAVVAACGSSSPSPSPTAPGGTASAPAAQSPAGQSPAGQSPAGQSPAVTSGGQAPVPVESNPPGDIPDNLAFVPYANSTAGYSFTHPEGWAETEDGAMVTFTDKLNGITADTASLPSALTVEAVQKQEVARLASEQPAFELVSVDTATLPAGPTVKVVYRRNSAPDPVTGRQVRDEVEEYLVGTGSSGLRLALSGPVGADNVDAYATISQSLALP